MIETTLFSSNGIPCFDYQDDRHKTVALAINAATIVRKSPNGDSTVEIQPRPNVTRVNYSDKGTGGNSLRATDPTRQCAELLGQWENFIPGFTATVMLNGSLGNYNTGNLLVMVTGDNLTAYRVLDLETTVNLNGIPTLKTAFSKAIVFIENGHFFILVQGLGTERRNMLIDLWLFRGVGGSTNTTFFSADAPSVRINTLIYRKNSNSFESVTVTNIGSPSSYLTPQRTGIIDIKDTTYTVSAPITGLTQGEPLLILGTVVSELRTAYYYPTESRFAQITLPAGDTSVKVPDAVANYYHLAETETSQSGIYLETGGTVTGDARLGDAVINRGFAAADVNAGVDVPFATQSPITATNNVGVFGTQFVQWIQPKASAFKTTVSRGRLAPPTSATDSVICFSDSGAPHLRFAAAAVTNARNDSFVVGNTDRLAFGIILSDNCANPITGEFHAYMSISQSQIGDYTAYNTIHVPFARRGRTHYTPGQPRYVPLFGVNSSNIKDFFDIGNGRLAIVTNSNEILISSPVRTWTDYPSFLDFQVLIDAPNGLTAETYKITARNITSIISYQAGYLISTDEGLFSINNITGVISKVNDSDCMAVVFSGGLYITINRTKSYFVYQYDDNIKQLVEVFKGSIHPELFSRFGTDYRNINNNTYSYYYSRKNLVLARDNSSILFLDENNILHNHNYGFNRASFCGRLFATIPVFTSEYYGVYPVIGQLGTTYPVTNQVDNAFITNHGYATTVSTRHIYNLDFSFFGSLDPQTMRLTQRFLNVPGVSSTAYETACITTLAYTVPKEANKPYVEYTQNKVEVEYSSDSNVSLSTMLLYTLYSRYKQATLNIASTTASPQAQTLTKQITMVSRFTYAKVCYWLQITNCAVINARAYSTPLSVNRR